MGFLRRGKTKWTGSKKFKCKCRQCGQQGHKATECRSNKKVCFECGKVNHFARDYPNKGYSQGHTNMFVGMLWCEEIENKGASKSGAVHGDVYIRLQSTLEGT